jgi:putative DNA primase/helicase
MGNAQRLVRRHGQDLRYVQEWGWLTWDGRRWQLGRSGEVMRRAKETALAILKEAEGPMAERARAKILAWARASQSRSWLEAMIALAQSEVGVPAGTDAFDTHDWLLNCRNGTLDLRTSELRPHRREDLLTRLVDVDYDPGASCPIWEQFLDRITDGSEALTGYLQRTIGYALTGDTGEQAMFLLYGTGANGKSTFLEVIRAIAGDYGRQSDPTTFLARQNGDRIPNDIARLAGARFVSAIEVEEGRRLSEVLVKQVVSGDTLTARFLNREFFEFRARFKLFLAANHKPVVRGTDEGIWRRIRLIPFTVTIPKAERDRTLLTRLQDELPGILAWAVRGCLAFTQQGLADPPEVLAATDSYRSEMDVIGAFVAERCVVADCARAECGALYSAYAQWCEENGEHAVSQRRFGQQLEERGFARRRGTNGKWCRSGIGLLDDRASGGTAGHPSDDFSPGDPGASPLPSPDVAPPDEPQAEQEGLDLTEDAPEVIQVTQGDPTFRVPTNQEERPCWPGISWSYVRRLLAIGDAVSIDAVRTHCLLAGVPVDDVIAQVKEESEETSAPSRGPPDGV